MLGVSLNEAMNKKLEQVVSSLAVELAEIPKEETSVVRLNDANIYKCTHSFFIDRGFKHPFFLIERMTEEGMEDICEVMSVCTERCFSMSCFITRFADVVKIPEPMLASVQINDLVSPLLLKSLTMVPESAKRLKLNSSAPSFPPNQTGRELAWCLSGKY